MKLVTTCPVCHKVAAETHAFIFGPSRIVTYACGHTFTEQLSVELSERPSVYDSVQKDKTAREYQRDGVDFIRGVGRYSWVKKHRRGPSCILGDQMRLGKTPQAELFLASEYAERTPCLLIVKGANKWQWIREHKIWCDSLPLGIFPIESTKSFIAPGFSVYIISMDLFSRSGKCKTCGHAEKEHNSKAGYCQYTQDGIVCTCEDYIGGNSMVDRLLTFGFKMCIVDEAHSFKNVDSKRAKALTQFLQELSKEDVTYVVPFTCLVCKHEWEEKVTKVHTGNATNATERVSKTAYCTECGAYNQVAAQREIPRTSRKCECLMLTGTAIKNRANEYFFPLNIVAPALFPNRAKFVKDWCTPDGKRLNPHRVEQFRETTAPFILRREWTDVYTDLPPITRSSTVIKIEDQKLKDLYNAKLDEIEATMNSRTNFTYFDNIGELQILRHITGLAKVNWCVDTLMESIDSSDKNMKFAVGLHHHGVKDGLQVQLRAAGIKCVSLNGTDSPYQKDYVMRTFETDDNQVLLINMLAGGVGMDFHYCHNVMILERQWSSADEEQFEARFYNPDKSIQGNHVTYIEYVLAAGTIDEWFHNLVESKKQIFGEAVANNWDMVDDPISFRSLMEQTVAHRL